MADETVVPMMLCENRVEERVSAECPGLKVEDTICRTGRVIPKERKGECIARANKHK
jgi:hypothetical protein